MRYKGDAIPVAASPYRRRRAATVVKIAQPKPANTVNTD
jgi:hypothetical protein